MPRIVNFLPADQHTGRVRHGEPPGWEVDVDLVWDDGVQETVRGQMRYWMKAGEGEHRRMMACFVEWSDTFGFNRAAWMPPETVRRVG